MADDPEEPNEPVFIFPAMKFRVLGIAPADITIRQAEVFRTIFFQFTNAEKREIIAKLQATPDMPNEEDLSTIRIDGMAKNI